MKTVVITGATSGIGLETSRMLTDLGYCVIGVGRTDDRCKRAKEDLLAHHKSANIEFFSADLMQQEEVTRVADEIEAHLSSHYDGKLHALINNAGCVRSWYMTTPEGCEQQFALNYLAGFLFTAHLFPCLYRAKGRVIMTGSASHKGIKVHWDDIMLRRGYHPLTAYKQSKLCNILFAKSFNERYENTGVRAYVVDPGLARTDIGNKDTGTLVNFVWTLRKKFGVAPQISALTYTFLCEQEEAPEGLYYYRSRESRYSKQVTSGNAERLFSLSERLCAVQFDRKIVL